jgi:phosphoglycolate phosphatase-like HAD superfamily hydrolase
VNHGTDLLVLWDIDGTLTHSGTVAGEVFTLAVEQVFGSLPSGAITFAGKTDRAIAEEFLALAGSTDPEHPDMILDIVEAELAARADEILSGGQLLPGAREAIEALGKIPGVAQSVLTGNVAANARLKLATFGIDTLLDLEAGAYGRDHVDRGRLLPIAWQRQRELRNRTFGPATTWIIGDTPRDLACAQSSGAHCLLVGTGRFAFDELCGIGADDVVRDLSDTERIVAIVTGWGAEPT